MKYSNNLQDQIDKASALFNTTITESYDVEMLIIERLDIIKETADDLIELIQTELGLEDNYVQFNENHKWLKIHLSTVKHLQHILFSMLHEEEYKEEKLTTDSEDSTIIDSNNNSNE